MRGILEHVTSPGGKRRLKNWFEMATSAEDAVLEVCKRFPDVRG